MEKLECPECGKNTMFQNRAGGLTCANKDCETVIFHCSAEESRKMQCLIRSGNEIIKKQGEIIERYEKLVKQMER